MTIEEIINFVEQNKRMSCNELVISFEDIDGREHTYWDFKTPNSLTGSNMLTFLNLLLHDQKAVLSSVDTGVSLSDEHCATVGIQVTIKPSEFGKLLAERIKCGKLPAS